MRVLAKSIFFAIYKVLDLAILLNFPVGGIDELPLTGLLELLSALQHVIALLLLGLEKPQGVRDLYGNGGKC